MKNWKNNKDKSPGEKLEAGFGGILKGLGELVGKLGELAEKGQEISKTGELVDKDKEVKGIYGFTIKFGLGEKAQVEPFGNIRKDEKSGEAIVHEIREPVIDVFEEDGYTLIVMEMPGVSVNDVKLEIKDDMLTIYAEKGAKKYRKEVLLPQAYQKEKMIVSSNNGILEIKCMK